MATTPLDVRWLRVILGSVAVHVVGVVVSVALIVTYSVVTAGGSVDHFAGPLSTWILPVLTLPAAVWAAYGARRAAALNGSLVSLLVAGMLGVLFFWPFDPRSLALFALIIASGLAGGLIGGKLPSRP
jgi:uncharacterized membrane protein YkvI